MENYESRYDAALRALRDAAKARGEREASARIRRKLEAEIEAWTRWDPRAFCKVLDRICSEAPGEPERKRPSAYRDALAGVVALPAFAECSLADFGRRLAVTIRDEQSKLLPDNALLALLCDAARMGDELVREMERQDFIDGPVEEALPCPAPSASVRTALNEEAAPAPESCTWTQQDDQDGECWETDCGEAFCMIDGAPAENGLRFCCYCGRPLSEEGFVPGPEEDDDGAAAPAAPEWGGE